MDRTICGLLAGVIAAIPMNIWSLFSFYILGYADFRLLDWGAFVFFGHQPKNLTEIIAGQVAQILWCGFLGILFSLLIPVVSSKYLILKGVFFGFLTGFIIYAIPTILQTPIIGNVSTGTAVSNSLSGIIWGYSLTYTLIYLNKYSRL